MRIEEYRGGVKRRLAILRSARDYEAVILHRKLINPLELRLLRHYSRRLVFDFDDAVMFRDSNAACQKSASRRRGFASLAAGSDLLIAGNSYLAGWAGRYNRRVVVIPTAVDLSVFPDTSVPPRANVIGWIGSGSNLVYLEQAAPALSRLAREGERFVFKLISDSFREIAGVETIRKHWSKEDEVKDLLSLAVGIAPLRDDPWAGGKCAFKIIQYFAAFRPVVCSPVGANREIVQAGVNGLFAASASEWRDSLRRLLRDPRLREEMGRAGRRLVEKSFSLQAISPRLEEALRSLVR